MQTSFKETPASDIVIEEQKRLAERKAVMLKEIDLIQDVIKRMANTSFIIKGWTVTMISVIFAYKSDIKTTHFVLIPILLFWFLDAYFLQHERLYRRLYTWVIENRMKDDSRLFSLNTLRFRNPGESIFREMFSLTLGMFYGGGLILVIAYIFSLLFFPVLLPPCQ